jgi:3-ketosteroid 9alpha-monooxygenase subunit B
VTSVLPLHRYHRLRIAQVKRETSDAVSIVFDVPAELHDIFSYRPGQFVSVKIGLDGEEHIRSYSMSSTPGIDPNLQVTVKRVAGGLVSNWLNEEVAAGTTLSVNPPGGGFVLENGDHEILFFAAGSGITPIFSIVKGALAYSDRPIRLLYANRNRESTIFRDEIDRLQQLHGDRFRVAHHLDDEDGFVDQGVLVSFAGDLRDGEAFVCGPSPFMDLVQEALSDSGIPAERVHVERFTPIDDVATGELDDIQLVITLGRQTMTVAHRENSTILHAARGAGLRAPSSCETGSCATCMARVIEGDAEMRHNEALTPEEIAEGWILTCQAVPVTPVVKVVYE